MTPEEAELFFRGMERYRKALKADGPEVGVAVSDADKVDHFVDCTFDLTKAREDNNGDLASSWRRAQAKFDDYHYERGWNDAIEAAAKDVEMKEGVRTPYLADSIRLLKKTTISSAPEK